mgnify:FL=1
MCVLGGGEIGLGRDVDTIYKIQHSIYNVQYRT